MWHVTWAVALNGDAKQAKEKLETARPVSTARVVTILIKKT